LLTAVHVILQAYLAMHDSPTLDEPALLAAGVSHITTGDLSLYRVNPPLVRSIAALPVALAGPRVDWREAHQSRGTRREFDVGSRFCRLNGKRCVTFFTLARLACIPFSALGCLVVGAWAAEWFGPRSGVIAAALWCCSPNLLGHGHLLTADVPAASLGVAACYAFARWVHEPTWVRSGLAGVVGGLAILAKTTWILLVVLWPVMWLFARLGGRSRDAPSKAHHTLLQAVTIPLAALLTINQFYGWEGTWRPLQEYRFFSTSLKGAAGAGVANRFRGSLLGRLPVPLPASLVEGIDLQKVDFERPTQSYLRGEIREGGWWWYYLYGLSIKTPVGTLALIILGTLAFLRYRTSHVSQRAVVAFLLLPALAILALVSWQTNVVRHLRYVFPALPFLFVWASQVDILVGVSRIRRILLVVMPLVATVVATWSSFPYCISYFNVLVGGSERGHLHLLDSSVDWGQDLYALKQWYDEHPEARPFYLAACGMFDPNLIGIRFDVPPSDVEWTDGQALEAGWYAISLHRLHGMTTQFSPDGRGGWSGPGDCSYFQLFSPVNRIGYSFAIYHIRDPVRVEDTRHH
jgi:hypothetical protein